MKTLKRLWQWITGLFRKKKCVKGCGLDEYAKLVKEREAILRGIDVITNRINPDTGEHTYPKTEECKLTVKVESDI